MARNSLFQEFIEFLAENKKWWLLPFLMVFSLIALILAFAATGAGAAISPFIYTIF